jgi:hypothetical protein
VIYECMRSELMKGPTVSVHFVLIPHVVEGDIDFISQGMFSKHS